MKDETLQNEREEFEKWFVDNRSFLGADALHVPEWFIDQVKNCIWVGWHRRADMQSGNSEVIQDFLRVLDEYPEQLVPINRNSAVVRALRNAAGGNSAQPVTVPDEPWRIEAEKQAEIYGQSFVVFRNGEQPQCADQRKVVISFTDEGLGYPSAPQEPTK